MNWVTLRSYLTHLRSYLTHLRSYLTYSRSNAVYVIYGWIESLQNALWTSHELWRDMTRSYVGRDSFICVMWLIHIWHVTHWYVGHNSFICVTWLKDMTHSYVWCDSFICGTCDSFMYVKKCTLNVSWATKRHDSFVRVTWLELYVWPDSIYIWRIIVSEHFALGEQKAMMRHGSFTLVNLWLYFYARDITLGVNLTRVCGLVCVWLCICVYVCVCVCVWEREKENWT